MKNKKNNNKHTEEKKRKIGRPTIFSDDLAKEICRVIASSSKGTKRLCDEREHWPCQDTLFTWLKDNSAFSEQYRLAKQHKADILADEILEIADNSSKDVIFNQVGHIVINQAAVARAKLQVDSRKWLITKLAPKVYGDKIIPEVQNNHLTHEQALILLAGDDYQSLV